MVNIQSYEQRCREAFRQRFSEEASLGLYFGEFWKRVYQNRGSEYFERLRFDFVGNETTKPFYGATENNFRHWLSLLPAFERNAPPRIPLSQKGKYPLPDFLEGALIEYGWIKTWQIAALAIALVPDDAE